MILFRQEEIQGQQHNQYLQACTYYPGDAPATIGPVYASSNQNNVRNLLLAVFLPMI